MKNVHDYLVNATLTELRREAGKILSAVLHRNQTVRLTRHGKMVAQIQPSPQAMPLEQFSTLWRQRPKLDQATAEEVAKAIRENRRAECVS